MSWSRQCENGCVPTEAIFNPLRPASSASLLRSSSTWARASTIDWQISVPSSTTDWCISGLICSLSVTFPPSRISWMCDRSSRVSGSLMANSPSIPRVNTCFLALIRAANFRRKRLAVIPSESVAAIADRATGVSDAGYKYLSTSRELAEFALVHCRLHVFAPAQIITAGFVLARFADRHFGNGFDHPFEICLTDVSCFGIRCGITKINRDRHAVANRKLDRVQVVTKKLVQRQHASLDFLQDFHGRLPFSSISQMIWMPRLVRHKPHVSLID